MTQELKDFLYIADVRESLFGEFYKNYANSIFGEWQKSNQLATKGFVASFGSEGNELRKVSLKEQINQLEANIRQESEWYLNIVKKDGKDAADIFLDLWETKKKEQQLKRLKSNFLLVWTDKKDITDEMIIKAKEFPFQNLIEVNQRGYAHCPFHQDKTPSMWVKNNFGHCFSCDKTLDTIQFVIETYKIRFPEAVRKLCT